MLNDLDALTIFGIKLTAESTPTDYHAFAGKVLGISRKYHDIALIRLSTELAALLSVQNPYDPEQQPLSSFGVFSRIWSNTVERKVGEILTELETIKRLEMSQKQIKKEPSAKIKNDLKKVDGYAEHGIRLGTWSCHLEDKNGEWHIWLLNDRFSTAYEALFQHLKVVQKKDTFLEKLLDPSCLKSESGSVTPDTHNPGIDVLVEYGDIIIEIETHDHDYDTGCATSDYVNDMGVRIRISFKENTSAEKFWNEIIALRFEDLFLPEFVKILSYSPKQGAPPAIPAEVGNGVFSDVLGDFKK